MPHLVCKVDGFGCFFAEVAVVAHQYPGVGLFFRYFDGSRGQHLQVPGPPVGVVKGAQQVNALQGMRLKLVGLKNKKLKKKIIKNKKKIKIEKKNSKNKKFEKQKIWKTKNSKNKKFEKQKFGSSSWAWKQKFLVWNGAHLNPLVTDSLYLVCMAKISI